MAGISKEERSELLRAIKVADTNFTKGMYALAEPTYRKGVEFLGDGAPEITGCLQNLALICTERKDFNEALKLDIHLLLLNEERFGEDHAKTIALMDEIASLYEKLGRADESRDMYERARKASERSIWADQINEPDQVHVAESADVDGVPAPAEIAKELGLGYQYSDTAKSALEIGLPKPGEVSYEFGAAAVEQRKRDSSEETMKLPQIRDDQLSAKNAPQQKDPQLETLILDKSELKRATAKHGNGVGGIGDSAKQSLPASAPSAAGASAEPPTSDILRKIKSKLSESITTPVVDPKAPLLETPEVIGVDAIKPGEWKSDDAMSKVVLGGSPKQTAKDKLGFDMSLVEKPPAQEYRELERSSSERAVEPELSKSTVTEVKLFRSDKQRKWILGIFMGCFLMLLVASLFTSHANTQEDFKNMAHRYRTVDGEKLFFLTSPSDCEFVAGSESAKMPYYQHHGDVLDTCRIIFGPLLHHPHWLTKIKDGLIDEDGATLYSEASPELDVTDFAEEVGRAAQVSYLRTKHYPKKLEEIEANKRVYRNPFSGQVDKPNIQFVALGKKTQADDGGQRKKYYDLTLSGLRWPNEVGHHPGGINCYSVVIHTKKGDINTFYIRAFNRDNRSFASSQPDTAYAIVLENGAVKASPRPHLTFAGKPAIRPHRAWLLPVMNPTILFFFRYGAAILFALVAFASWILSETIRKNRVASSALKGVMVLCLALMIAYLLNGVLP